MSKFTEAKARHEAVDNDQIQDWCECRDNCAVMAHQDRGWLIEQHERLVAEVALCRKIINGAATVEQELAYMYPEPKP